MNLLSNYSFPSSINVDSAHILLLQSMLPTNVLRLITNGPQKYATFWSFPLAFTRGCPIATYVGDRVLCRTSPKVFVTFLDILLMVN
jgi:hypothetical protein